MKAAIKTAFRLVRDFVFISSTFASNHSTDMNVRAP
jgi:hypothetical protein